jgi:hypothetical protein
MAARDGAIKAESSDDAWRHDRKSVLQRLCRAGTHPACRRPVRQWRGEGDISINQENVEINQWGSK